MNSPNLKRGLHVWRRNFDVFKSYYIPSLTRNILEPLILLFGLGLGIGTLVETVNGLSYLEFIAPGMLVSFGMITATFECTFGAYTRMAEQKVYNNMLATPLAIEDIVLGEILWGTTKTLFSAMVMLVILMLIGLFKEFAMIPLILLNMLALGATFSALAICVSANVSNYESFNFYFTIVITPLMLFSGIYFPADKMPEWFENLMLAFPTPHAVNINHYLFYGINSGDAITGAIYLLLFVPVAVMTAGYFVRKRLIPAG